MTMSSTRADTVNCRNILSDRKVVPDDQLKLFCQILQDNRSGEVIRHADGEYHIHKDFPQTHRLKFPLSKPNAITRKFFLPKQSAYTFLCEEHTLLNADFVHQWFNFIQLEVGARLEILRSSTREFIGPYAWDNIVKPLTRLHRIWMKDAAIAKTFGGFCHEGFDGTIDMIDPSYQEDGCEACILRRIGSHINTLHALQCIIKSRLSFESQLKHPTRLRLLRIIDPWIDLLDDKYGISQDSEQRMVQHKWIKGLSEELHEQREAIKLDRHIRARAQRHLLEVHHSNPDKYKQYVRDLDNSAIDGNIHDAENDVIDAYAALRASQRASVMASVDIVAGNILDVPDFPSYQIQAPTPRPEGRTSPYGPIVDRAYIESRYSVDTVRNNERVVKEYSAHLADLPPSPQVGRCDSRDSQQTVWPTTSILKFRASAMATTEQAQGTGACQNERQNDPDLSVQRKKSTRRSESNSQDERTPQANIDQKPKKYFQSRFKEDLPSEPPLPDSYGNPEGSAPSETPTEVEAAQGEWERGEFSEVGQEIT